MMLFEFSQGGIQIFGKTTFCYLRNLPYWNAKIFKVSEESF